MAEFTAPLAEIRFALDELARLPEIAALPGYEQASDDLVTAIIDEAGKLADTVLAPLNATGDREGSVLENGAVRTPAGFAAAYRRYVERVDPTLPANDLEPNLADTAIELGAVVTAGLGEEAEWRDTVRFWKECGVTDLTLTTYSGRGHLCRIAGRSLKDHIEAIRRYWNAVADLL